MWAKTKKLSHWLYFHWKCFTLIFYCIVYFNRHLHLRCCLHLLEVYPTEQINCRWSWLRWCPQKQHIFLRRASLSRKPMKVGRTRSSNRKRPHMRFGFPIVGKRVDASDTSVSFCPFSCGTFWSVDAFLLQLCKRHNKKPIEGIILVIEKLSKSPNFCTGH